MKQKKKTGVGLGIGYVSVMMIFAVICLTVLAVLSLRAADSNKELKAKNSSFVTDYYAADSSAKAALANLDKAAVISLSSGFFEDTFPELAAEEADDIRQSSDGFIVSFTKSINDKLELRTEVLFYSMPLNGERYKITSRKTCTKTLSEENTALNVWNGDT